MKRIRKISLKMLMGILPILIISMLALTMISENASKQIISEQITESMESELKANIHNINSYLDVVRNTAMNLSRTVGSTYQTADMDTYGKVFSQIIKDNDLVMGSGIWFEPQVYDKGEKYVGPYWYKDGEDIALTYDYSNAEYDYFSQEYYLLAKESDGQAVITDPYYDPTMDVIMASCTAPVYGADGKFIGVVTVDIALGAIEELVNGIQVGENGYAMLTTGDGTYLCCENDEKVASAVKISEDENTSLAGVAAELLQQDAGMAVYRDAVESYNLYYATVPGVQWKLMIRMPQSELNEPVNALLIKMTFVCVVALIFCIISVLVQVRNIAKNLGRVRNFAGSLAQGNFTVQKLKARSRDELGEMSESLNEMFENNRAVIGDIAEHSGRIKGSSERLNQAAVQLSDQFKKIENYMTDVNEAMMSASAATEEVNASVEEVNSSVSVLASEAEKSNMQADQIKVRAVEIEQDSQKAYEYARAICSQREQEMEQAYRNAAVVENIGVMANVISNIAEQINLLSLNASIEAARAGEQGRGFAVVASEIGKLAGETSKAVEEIQGTIIEVQGAFESITKSTEELLAFLKETVTPDYDRFVNIGKQYEEDAISFGSISERIREMSGNIEHIMEEVGDAIQNVAESAQETANNSSLIMNAVGSVAGEVKEVSVMSSDQEQIAQKLNGIVDQFQL